MHIPGETEIQIQHPTNKKQSITLIPELIINGIYTTIWAEGIMRLIYRKGDVNYPFNYWDIPLLSCLGKVFERVLISQIKIWETGNHVLNEEQVGFKSQLSILILYYSHLYIKHFIVNNVLLIKHCTNWRHRISVTCFRYIIQQGQWGPHDQTIVYITGLARDVWSPVILLSSIHIMESSPRQTETLPFN